MTLILRAATPSDYEGIVACLDRNNMLAWSPERWSSIWDGYPYRDEFEDVPRGFVLEAEGHIVGSISSVWAKYSLDGRVLRAIQAGSAAVDTAYRAGSIKLFGRQMVQPQIDLYLNGTASAVTSKITETLRVPRVPQADNDVLLLWPVNGRAVGLAGLRRRNVPLAGALAWPVGFTLGLASRIKLRRVRGAPIDMSRLDGFTAEFDTFWDLLRLRKELIGFRDRATLQWRFGPGMSAGTTIVLAARRGGVLVGYVVLGRTQRPAIGLEGHTIQDIQCIGEDVGVLSALLSAAWEATRAADIDLLEWAGFSGFKRAYAEQTAVLRYRLDVWQAYYYSRTPALLGELSSASRWDFSPYDTD